MAKNKRYRREFKLEAARLVVEHGYTFKEVAKRLGCGGSIGRAEATRSFYMRGFWVEYRGDFGIA